jgi:hypothetical protein
MTGEYITTGVIEGGKLEIRNRAGLSQALRGMKDGEVLVSIVRLRACRSQRQNAWYWGVIVQMLADHTGYTPDEMHEVLKAKFIPKRFAVSDGNGEIQDELVIGGSTSILNTVEFGEYCEAIRQWAADSLHVVIPDPIDVKKSDNRQPVEVRA